MLPGTLAGKATIPCPPTAEKVLNSIVLPLTARLSAPMMPRPPMPPPPPVSSWMASVIHPNSPTSETTLSPGSRAISRTGIGMPSILSSICSPSFWRPGGR